MFCPQPEDYPFRVAIQLEKESPGYVEIPAGRAAFLSALGDKSDCPWWRLFLGSEYELNLQGDGFTFSVPSIEGRKPYDPVLHGVIEEKRGTTGVRLWFEPRNDAGMDIFTRAFFSADSELHEELLERLCLRTGIDVQQIQVSGRTDGSGTRF
jgi:hypothetical protein